MRILSDPVLGGGGGGGGGGEVTWHASLPEDMRASPALQQIKGKDWGEAGPVLAKSYVEAQRLIGTNRLEAPQKHWGEKEWGDFYNKIGRPEKPDGYKVPDLKLANGVKFDDAKLVKAREHFHKLGLTPSQAEGMLTYYASTLNEAFEGETQAQTQSRISAEAKLKQELGGDTQYAAAVDMANSVVGRFGSPELAEFFKGNPAIGNHPEMVKFLHKVAGVISEDKAVGAGGGSGLVSTRTAATSEIQRLTGDKEFQAALNNRGNPGHKEAVDRWQHLFNVAYPGKQAEV